MVGHILLPAYSRQLRPGIDDADILPATVALELLTDLLCDDLVPAVEELAVVGCSARHEIAAKIADRTITLLKDTAGTLPLHPTTHCRLRLYCLRSAPDFTGVVPEFQQVAIEELTAAGFEVSVSGPPPSWPPRGSSWTCRPFSPLRPRATPTGTMRR